MAVFIVSATAIKNADNGVDAVVEPFVELIVADTESLVESEFHNLFDNHPDYDEDWKLMPVVIVEKIYKDALEELVAHALPTPKDKSFLRIVK